MKRRRIQGWMLLGLAILVCSGCGMPSLSKIDSDEIAYNDPSLPPSGAVAAQVNSPDSGLPGFQASPTLYLTSPATGFVPTPRPGMRIDSQLAITLREEHLRTPEENVAVYKSYIDQHGPGADPLPYHRLAVAKTQAGYHRDATKYFRFALRLAPDDPVILSDLGYCCYVQNELGDAEAVLGMAAEIAPRDPRVIDKLAHVMGMQGRYDEAAALFQQTMSPADAHAHLANACAVRGDHQAAQQWYAYSTNLSDVYRGPRMIANVPAPAAPQVAAPSQYQQQAPPQQQMLPQYQQVPFQQQAPPQFAQQQPLLGTQPYETPRQDPQPFPSPLGAMNPNLNPNANANASPDLNLNLNPELMAHQSGPVIENNTGLSLPVRPQSPSSPFAQYGESPSGIARNEAAQFSPQQEAGFAPTQEYAPAPVGLAPWDRDMSLIAEQPAIAMMPEQPDDSAPLGEASIGSSRSGSRNAFLSYQNEQSEPNPYDSSGRAPAPMTSPEDTAPWNRMPGSPDSTSNMPQSSMSPYDDAYVFQATVEEASPSQPRTFASVERYDYEDVASVSGSTPYEEANLADEIDAALSPLLAIVEPETPAESAPAPYADYGYGQGPAVEYATYPTDIEVDLVP